MEKVICLDCHKDITGNAEKHDCLKDMESMKSRFEERYKEFSFHHGGVTCFNDAVFRHSISKFIAQEISLALDRVVPDEDQYDNQVELDDEFEEDCGNAYETQGKAFSGGFNDCRSSVLSRVAAVKAEMGV